MKKLFNGIALGLVTLLMVPMIASAEARIVDPIPCEKVDCTDNICTSVCEIKVTGNEGSLSQFQGVVNIVSSSTTITKIEAGSGWTDLSTLTGNQTQTISLVAENAITASDFTLAKVYASTPVGTDCSMYLNNITVGTVKIEQEVKMDVKEEETVKTGNFLPVVLLVAGVGIAAIMVVSVKKNTKMYKI